MILDNNQDLLDCCILKADCVTPRNSYEKNGATFNFGYHYTVPIEKIDELQKFIKATFEYFGLPCSRVYITGFAVVSKNSTWTKERIVAQIKHEVEKINALKEEKHNLTTR